MLPEPVEGQLEFFDLKGQPAPALRRANQGVFQLHLRYDQFVLGGVAVLLGLTIIFACGVERGKQLVRFERMPRALQQSAALPSGPVGAAEPAPALQTSTASAASEKTSDAGQKKRAPAPAMAPKPQPRKLASGAPARSSEPPGGSRYAIQLITYSRPQSAAVELARLKARGERAFLVMREGRTSVYIGPFPSRSNAAKKLALLKARYQDCFMRTL